jgi:hypothetical protein
VSSYSFTQLQALFIFGGEYSHFFTEWQKNSVFMGLSNHQVLKAYLDFILVV